MNRLTLPSLLIALALCATPTAFFASTALAKNAHATDNKVEVETEGDDASPQSEKRDKVQKKVAAKKQEKQERFDANKLRACEKREGRFKIMMQQLSDRGVKQLGVFKSIADKTNTFYSTKGYHADGYTELAKEVDDLYNRSLTAVNATQAAKDDWSCENDSPIQAMNTFREAKKAEIATLKAYKDKVRELILLVKQAAGTAETTNEGGVQ